LVVGLVRSIRGLEGDVRIEVLTDRPESRFALGEVLHPEGQGPLTIVRAAPVADGPGWWLRFAEISDRAAAERLRGRYLEAEVPAQDRPSDAFWWHEVVGARVSDRTGRELGHVVDVYRAGGAEVFLVEGPGGHLDIPAVRAVIAEFRPLDGEIVVDADALGLQDREPA
jgi:16S rRNA processing protein RimM